MKRYLRYLMPMMFALLGGCSTLDVADHGGPLDASARWTVLPIVNHTDEPQAGLRAEAIVENLLRSEGIASVERYPAALNPDSVFEPAERKLVDEALGWARKEGLRYGLTGAVDEWRYKVGVDGEPAVGIALQVIDIETGAVVWSAVGAKSGWSRQALSAVAQSLLRSMVSDLPLEHPKD